MIARLVCAPNVVANEAAATRRLAHDDRRHFVQLDAAEGLGHVSPQEAEVAAAPAHERARERPVLLLEPVERRQHLAGDELVSRLSNQLVLVAQSLGREDRLGRVLDQPRPTAVIVCHVPILSFSRIAISITLVRVADRTASVREGRD